MARVKTKLSAWQSTNVENINSQEVAIQFKDKGTTEKEVFVELYFSTVDPYESNARQFRLGKKNGYIASHVSDCDPVSSGQDILKIINICT